MSTTYEEIEARLKAKAAEPSPESIKFERPGQAVIGKVRRYEKGSTDWGDCVICVLESLQTGNLASLWIFGKVLAGAFDRLQPRIGEVIRVEYLGEVHPEGGQRYKNWSLIVDRDEAQGQGLSYAEAAGTASAPKPQPDEPQHFPTTGDFHAADDAAAAQTAAETSTDDIPF